MSFPAKKLALMGMLIALSIVLKIPLLSVPNVEFFTFLIFSSGYLLGMMEGCLVGVISISIYTTLVTPYGLPPLPIAFAQIFSMALIGIAGGLAFKLNPISSARTSPFGSFFPFLIMGIWGSILTIIYDLFTNLASALVIGQFLPVMVSAIPFALIHLLSNLIIFMILSPLLLRLSGIPRAEI